MRQNGTRDPIVTASPTHQFIVARKYSFEGTRWSAVKNAVPTNATTHDEQMATTNSQSTSLTERKCQSILTTCRNTSAATVYTTMNSIFPTRNEYERTAK